MGWICLAMFCFVFINWMKRFAMHHFSGLYILHAVYSFFKKILKIANNIKFFTHVNLSMYSRKPGNYNGTIIFEIDIMKKSSPIN